MKRDSKLIIFGDGGSRGNPGESAYGFAIFGDNNDIIYSEGKRLGVTTNNVAEYNSVISALTWTVKNLPRTKHIHFKLDSLLVASQLSGKFKVKHPNMKPLFITVKKLEDKLNAQIIYSQIPREQNKVADRLVNEALDYKI